MPPICLPAFIPRCVYSRSIASSMPTCSMAVSSLVFCPLTHDGLSWHTRKSRYRAAFEALQFGRHDENYPIFYSVDFGVKNGAQRNNFGLGWFELSAFVHLQHVGGPPPPQTNNLPISCQFTWACLVLRVPSRFGGEGKAKGTRQFRSQERPTRMEGRAGPCFNPSLVVKG